jgi:putative transposase
VIDYIDAYRDRFGVEPICRILRQAGVAIAPSTYWAARTRPPSARAVRDATLKQRIAAVHAANYGVYGVRKMHAALVRDGVQIGRDQTGRLMRALGLAGVRRGRPVRTTRPDTAAERAADLVQRRFTADRPNRLWVCDLTYLRTWTGFAYLALVIDVYSRRIVGWSLATHLRTDLPLEALELAVWDRRDRQQQSLQGLVHHSDRGSQGGFNRPSQHLDDGGVWWVFASGSERSSSIEDRSLRRGGRRWLGGRIGSGSGRRSPAGSKPRTRAPRHACRGRSGSGGFDTLAA